MIKQSLEHHTLKKQIEDREIRPMQRKRSSEAKDVTIEKTWKTTGEITLKMVQEKIEDENKEDKEVGEDDVIRRKEKGKIYERRVGLGIRLPNF